MHAPTCQFQSFRHQFGPGSLISPSSAREFSVPTSCWNALWDIPAPELVAWPSVRPITSLSFTFLCWWENKNKMAVGDLHHYLFGDGNWQHATGCQYVAAQLLLKQKSDYYSVFCVYKCRIRRHVEYVCKMFGTALSSNGFVCHCFETNKTSFNIISSFSMTFCFTKLERNFGSLVKVYLNRRHLSLVLSHKSVFSAIMMELTLWTVVKFSRFEK